MALGAIGYVMALGQWEKVVIDLVSRPVEAGKVMAIHTVGGKAGGRVIGMGRCHKIVVVATDAIVSDPFKPQRRFGFVAIHTIGLGMGADQREAVVLMQLRNSVHQPVRGGMAPEAIVPDGLLVYIGMAGNTLRAGIGKNQGRVTTPAIHLLVLTFQ